MPSSSSWMSDTKSALPSSPPISTIPNGTTSLARRRWSRPARSPAASLHHHPHRRQILRDPRAEHVPRRPAPVTYLVEAPERRSPRHAPNCRRPRLRPLVLEHGDLGDDFPSAAIAGRPTLLIATLLSDASTNSPAARLVRAGSRSAPAYRQEVCSDLPSDCSRSAILRPVDPQPSGRQRVQRPSHCARSRPDPDPPSGSILTSTSG